VPDLREAASFWRPPVSISLPAAARSIGVSETTLKRMVRRGQASAGTADNGQRRFDISEVMRLQRAVKAQRQPRACRFCGRTIPQVAVVCRRLWCLRAYWRTAQRRYRARRRES
jgi:hypothetical protein